MIMLFLLQNEEHNGLDVDQTIIKNLLDKEKYIHQYYFCKLNDFYNHERLITLKSLKDIKEAIPIGTIDFVQTYFKIFHGLEKENPIEIPPCLRTDEFLKRKYSIVKAENIPKTGDYFIKDASQLKVFSYNGNMEYFFYDEIFDKAKENDTRLHLDKNHLYQVSEVVNILSEYRVYILDGEIYSVANYEGDPCIFPDMNLIKKANMIYSLQKDYPKSYTMDVMVTDRGTAIIECHILFSTGLYNTVWGTNWLYGYRDSKDYLLNHNTQIKEWSNF